MRIGFMHVKGSRSTLGYAYNFVNNVPDLSKVVTHKLVPTTGWSVIGSDSNESGAPASNVLDMNRSTIWHTPWSSAQTPKPHLFSVNIGAIRSVKGLAFRNRDNPNGVSTKVGHSYFSSHPLQFLFKYSIPRAHFKQLPLFIPVI